MNKVESKQKGVLKRRFHPNDFQDALRRSYLKRRALSDLDAVALSPVKPQLIEEQPRPASPLRKQTLIKPSRSITNLCDLLEKEERPAPPKKSISFHPQIKRNTVDLLDSDEEMTDSEDIHPGVEPVSFCVIPKGVDKEEWVQSHIPSSHGSPTMKPTPISILASDRYNKNQDIYHSPVDEHVFDLDTIKDVGSIPFSGSFPTPPNCQHPNELQGATPAQLDAYYQDLYREKSSENGEVPTGLVEQATDAVMNAIELVSWAKEKLVQSLRIF